MGSKFSEISQQPLVFMVQYSEGFSQKIDDLKKGLTVSFPKAEIGSYRIFTNNNNLGKSLCQVWVVDSKREKKQSQKPFQAVLVYQNDLVNFDQDQLVQKLKQIRK